MTRLAGVGMCIFSFEAGFGKTGRKTQQLHRKHEGNEGPKGVILPADSREEKRR